jgi:hypothetical protein
MSARLFERLGWKDVLAAVAEVKMRVGGYCEDCTESRKSGSTA